MTRLTLDIRKDIDLAILLPLLNRLQISYVRNEIIKDSTSIPSDIKVFLMKGLPEKDNFTEWAAEWERSREDSNLTR